MASAAKPEGDPTGATQQMAPGPVALDWRRLLTAFALTPLLAGFYPAIFLAEPALMPVCLIVAYISTILFGIPLVYYFDQRGYREWYLYIMGGAACALPSVIAYAVVVLPNYLAPFGLWPVIELLAWGAS